MGDVDLLEQLADGLVELWSTIILLVLNEQLVDLREEESEHAKRN